MRERGQDVRDCLGGGGMQGVFGDEDAAGAGEAEAQEGGEGAGGREVPD